jgi:hypothetical protein
VIYIKFLLRFPVMRIREYEGLIQALDNCRAAERPSDTLFLGGCKLSSAGVVCNPSDARGPT